jgi:hypothetical protein
MNDAIASWNKPLTGNPVTVYNATWIRNGTPITPPVSVPASTAGDANGYSIDFNTTNPTAPAQPGDVISIEVTPVDATDNLFGPTTTSNAVTEPTAPVAPGPVQNLTVVLS